MVYAVSHTSIRHSIVPGALVGRVDTCLKFVVSGCAPAGTMVSGLAAGRLSLRVTVAAGTLGTILAAHWLLNPRTFRAIAILEEGRAAPVNGR